MDLYKCRCGGEPVPTEGANRIARRKAAVDTYRQAVEETKGKPRRGEVRRTLEQLEALIGALSADVYELVCDQCGSLVWHETKDGAENRWNRAIAKLEETTVLNLAKCEIRTDSDGMVMALDHESGRRFILLGVKAPEKSKV